MAYPFCTANNLKRQERYDEVKTRPLLPPFRFPNIETATFGRCGRGFGHDPGDLAVLVRPQYILQTTHHMSVLVYITDRYLHGEMIKLKI